MTFPSREIWGVRLHDVTPGELCAWIDTALGGDRVRCIVTPNPEFLLAARRSSEYRDVLNRADLALPDGVGVTFAALALGEELRHRHAGVDVLELLAEHAAMAKASLVLLGGSHPFLERARQYFATQYPGISCTAINPGIVDTTNQHIVSQNVLHQLTVADAKIIAVALGQGRGSSHGKQERYINELAAAFPTARILIGVGGAIDYFGSAVSRAPKLWRTYGFEWLWRLGAEPWRAKRVVRAVVVFPLRIAWDTLVSGQFIPACRRVARGLLAHFRG